MFHPHALRNAYPFADLIKLRENRNYVLFAVGGELIILWGAAFRWKGIRNPLFRISHLVAVALVAVEAAMAISCPLTLWEYGLRQAAGQEVEKDLSFIARVVRLIVFYDFPSWVFTVLHIAFGLLVLFTYILIPPRFQKRGTSRP